MTDCACRMGIKELMPYRNGIRLDGYRTDGSVRLTAKRIFSFPRRWGGGVLVTKCKLTHPSPVRKAEPDSSKPDRIPDRTDQAGPDSGFGRLALVCFKCVKKAKEHFHTSSGATAKYVSDLLTSDH